jgi:hypothetical protein
MARRFWKIRSIFTQLKNRTATKRWSYVHRKHLTQTTNPHQKAIAPVHADHQRWNVFQKHRQGSEGVFRLVKRRSNDIDPVNNQE